MPHDKAQGLLLLLSLNPHTQSHLRLPKVRLTHSLDFESLILLFQGQYRNDTMKYLLQKLRDGSPSIQGGDEKRISPP